jgi:hypothetical protein
MTAQRTDKQKEASRQNGARSKGPSSPEGRSRSAQNSLTHGLTAKKLIPGEDSDAFHKELTAWKADYRPATAAALILTEECARASVNLRRIAR